MSQLWQPGDRIKQQKTGKRIGAIVRQVLTNTKLETGSSFPGANRPIFLLVLLYSAPVVRVQPLILLEESI